MTNLEPIFGRIEAHEPAASRRDIVRVLFKHRWRILLCFVIVTAVTVGGVAMLPPTYETAAKVLVQTEQQATPTFFSGLAAYSERRDFDPVSKRLETEMGLIEAAPISAQVVRELGLGWDEVYHTPLGQVGTGFRKIAGPWLERAFGITFQTPSQNEIAAEFQRSLGVSLGASKGAETTPNIIAITLQAPKPTVARDALARLLAIYLDWDRRLNQEAGLKALDLVSQELGVAERQVVVAEESMRKFLAAAKFDPARPEASRHVAPDSNAGLITSPGDDQTITQLKSAQVQFEVDLARAREIYLPNSESIRTLERSVSRLEKRVADEVGRNADNYARFNQLDRRLRTAEARFNELGRREAEIRLFIHINGRPTPSRMVIEPPLVPEKSDWQRRALFAVSGSVAGLLLGLLWVGLSEYTDGTLRSKQQVRRHIGIDVLAVVPKATSRELRALRAQPQALPAPDSSLGMRWGPTFEALAQRVAMSVANGDSSTQGGRSVLVTSPRSGEGKTFTAGLLAYGLSQLGFGTVLLVDADINSSRYARHGRPSPWNLSVLPTVELGQERIDEPGTPQTLTVLGADDTSKVAGDLTGAKLQRFLAQERPRFDWIIFDGGPIGRGGVNALAREVDAVLLVIAAEETRREVVQDALDSLGLDSREKVKVVLNRSRYHIPTFLYDEV